MKSYKILLLLVILLAGFGLSACDTSSVIDDDPIIDDNSEDDPNDTTGDNPDDGGDPVEEIVDLSNWDDLTGRTITFFDDFDGTELDETVWEHMIGTGSAYGISYWGNNEKQYYQPDNTTVSNGEMRIELRKEQVLADNNTGTMMQYTSSRLRTKGAFSQTYGRFEARIRIDTAEKGLWPAFWLLPENNVYGGWPYSGEFDIMEIRGSRPFESTAALHYSDTRHTYFADSILYPENTDMTDFHVYALEWTPTTITYYMDDMVVLHIDDWNTRVGEFPAPFDQDFHILLNFAVGGNFDGNVLPDDSALPATMIVDYIKVLALDNEDGRKQPEGTGDVYLINDEITIDINDGPIDLEFYIFDGMLADVAWFTSDSSIAYVNQAGKVTPRTTGEVQITVKTGTSEATCTVIITDNQT